MKKNTNSQKFKVIDLFAGAGGLSLGFQNTGDFNIVAAIEKNPNAQATYRENFENVELYSDIKDIDFHTFTKKYGDIDVVIGGPPCQGFSNANRQHNQAINSNNKLVKEYIRAILELQPSAFVMENVSMLKSEVHRFYIERDDAATVKKYAIPIVKDQIDLLEEKYKFPDAIKIIGNYQDIISCCWDHDLFSIINIYHKYSNNSVKLSKAIRHYGHLTEKLCINQKRSQYQHINNVNEPLFKLFLHFEETSFSNENLLRVIEEPLKIQKMLIRAREIYDNHIEVDFTDKLDVVANVKSCAVLDYLLCILKSDVNRYAINNNILSAADFGVPQKRRRYVVIGVKKDFTSKVDLPAPDPNIKKSKVRDAIFDLEKVPIFYSTEDDEIHKGRKARKTDSHRIHKLTALRDNSRIYNHVIPNTRDTALERFKSLKQGQNFHSLSKELKENTYSNAEKTQNTVYLRLDYKNQSGTVVNVRKSMWIHPTIDRAISIREAARLQTFPDSFIFRGPKDSQYQQVGNAVPPMLAEEIAKKISFYLKRKQNDR